MIKEILNDGGNVQILDPNILIGVFEEINNASSDGKYLLIVNKDVLNTINVKIVLNSSKRFFELDKEKGNKINYTKSDLIRYNLPPGTGQLIYIE